MRFSHIAFVVIALAVVRQSAAQDVRVVPLPASREPFVVAVPTPSPTGLWPAVIAVGGVLLGSFVTHFFESRRQAEQRNADKARLDVQLCAERERLDIQLAHDREARAQESLAGLRRDAAFRLAVALPGAGDSLLAMASGNPVDRSTDRLDALADAAAHYQLVGSPDALGALLAFNGHLQQLLLWMIEAGQPVADAHFEVEKEKGNWDRTHAEFERVGREMAVERESARPDASRLKTLAAQWAFLNQRLDELSETRKLAFHKYADLNQRIRAEVTERLGTLGGLQSTLGARLRVDLGVQGDLARLQEDGKTARAQLDEKITEFDRRDRELRRSRLERLVTRPNDTPPESS